MKIKKKLLVSFSGGETSGYLLWFIMNIWSQRDEYDIIVVYANTGEENEETLLFIKKCSEFFNIKVVWVEALIMYGVVFNGEKYIFDKPNLDVFKLVMKRKLRLKENGFKKLFKQFGVGTRHTIVDFNTASRNGEPFENVIRKYGIPNQAFPHCNRELKLRPIHSYIKSELGWDNYYTAIGIRYEEIDRMVVNRKTYNIIYPLIEDTRMTKQKINFWWSQQPFRLKLKGYQGNCKTCWKKSFKNLYTIAKEEPAYFDFFKTMEIKYGKVTPLGREKVLDSNNNKKIMTFFRGGKSVDEVINESKYFTGGVVDANLNTNYQVNLLDMIDEVESCDIFSNCGDN